MAGTAADCELNRAVRFAVAGDADDADIRRLLRENPMRGAVSVSFEREPDYFHAGNLLGADDQTIVAREAGRLVCVGRRVTRECWINGHATTAGYLAELRLDATARRRFAIVRDGYRFFRTLNPDGLHFTSIASDNARARRLLESGVRGMPAYSFLGELVTLLVAVPRQPVPPKLRLEVATEARFPELVALLNQHGRRHHLATVWTQEKLHSLARHGLPTERIQVVTEAGKIMACAGLWDQRSFRQTVVRAYAGTLGVARPWVNATNRILGRPLLPSPGTTVPQAFLSLLALADGAEDLLPDLVEGFSPVASALGIAWLTLALPADDPRLPMLRRRFITRSWASRLYRVSWPEQPEFKFAPDRKFLPEASLL